MNLKDFKVSRYERQIKLFGKVGQAKLSNAKVAIIGLGGLGCAVATYLAAAGVGRLTLIDYGEVKFSNLNRQILYWTKDLGKPKPLPAAEKLKELNPEVEVEVLHLKVDEGNVDDIVKDVDIIVDGADNWATRFLLNDRCIEYGKPFIHASVHGYFGQELTIVPGKGPCLRCLIPRSPPERGPLPILGTTAGTLALIQATETLKLITGYGIPAIGKLIIYDGFSMEFKTIRVRRRVDCPICNKLNLK